MPKNKDGEDSDILSELLELLKKRSRSRSRSPHRRRRRHRDRRRRHYTPSSSPSPAPSTSKQHEPTGSPQSAREDHNPAPHYLDRDDWIQENETENQTPANNNQTQKPDETSIQTLTENDSTQKSDETPMEGQQDNTSSAIELDSEALLILGEDPLSVTKHGQDIRKELASRLQHAATEGIGKESRKELLMKYLVPANCTGIDAPKINPEIKAAIPETISKRDRGIETKQKQIAAAIACIAEIINTLLNKTDRDNDTLQKLMDAARILCDAQHADSVTRRNFILFALKKDIKEHLMNTKIDSTLFGDNLAEIIKSAKMINKSGVELKADTARPTTRKPNQTPVSTNRNHQSLNYKPAAPARRPLGAAPPRSRVPAAPRAPPLPPVHSSKTSSRHHQPQSLRNRR